MFSLREIFNLAIQIERNGEQFYRDALKKVSDASLISLLEWLANEEVKHREWFTQKKETVKTRSEYLQVEKMGSALLQNILGDQSFSLKEADLSKIDRVDALLKLAVEFEKDSILFYEMVGTFMDDEDTTGHLNEIIAEENRHIQLLQGSQDNVANRPCEG